MIRQVVIKILLYMFIISLGIGIIPGAIIKRDESTSLNTNQPRSNVTTRKPELLAYESNILENGSSFSYSQSDGQTRNETIIILNKGTDDEEIVVTGKYSFRADNGFTYVVTYVADRNGYNSTVDKYPTRRISPTALKSLVG